MKKMNNMDDVIVLAAQNPNVAKALAEVEACEIAIKKLKDGVTEKLANIAGNDKAEKMIKFVTAQVHLGIPMSRYKARWIREFGTQYGLAYSSLVEANAALEELIEEYI